MTKFEKALAYILAINSNTKKLIATYQINFIKHEIGQYF